MDSDSPTSRVERTFWTVWNYITEAVSRFFRTEPTNITSNDPNSTQKSAVDSELANIGHAEGDTSRREVDEDQPLATASLLSSSRPLVAWELCTTDVELGSNEESMQCKTQPSRGSESKASVEGEGTKEEQFPQVGHDDDAGLLVAKENEDQNLSTGGQDEMPENTMCEEHANARLLRLTGDAMSEDVEESGREADAEEETERAVSSEDPQKMAETIQEKEADDQMQHEDLQAEDMEVKLCLITDLSLEEEEDNMHMKEADTEVMHEEIENRDGEPQLTFDNDEGAKQVENQVSECEKSDDDSDIKGFTSSHVELQMAHEKSDIVSKDDQIVFGQEHAMAHRSETDNAEDAKEEEDEREQGAVEENVSEAANNQTIDEAPEQEDDIKTITEDSQEEDILTVRCSGEVMQNAKAEMHAADGEQEDMAEDTDVQTKTREMDDNETEGRSMVIDEKSDVTAIHISVDERFFYKNQGEEGKLSNKDSYMETACTTTSVTLRPEGKTGQEMSGEFKNIPLGVCEGRAAVSQELNFPTCKETQEGVPGYNNEPGPVENTTQRFLEDCEEIQGSQLPEEVESKELESLQNSGSGADYILVREPMEEEQEGPQDTIDSSDAGLPQEMEKPLVETVIQETGFEEEEGELLVDFMKTGIKHSEEEYKSDVELRKVPEKLAKELQDGTEELLIEFEIDKGLCDAAEDGSEVMGAVTAQEDVGFTDENFLEAEAQKMTETSFFQETVDAINSVQNSNTTPGSVEDITESGFLKQSDETEPELLEDAEMQDAGIDMEEAAEDEMLSKSEILHLAESESSGPVESLETKYQRSDEALEMSNEEMLIDTEVTDESKTNESELKDLILISTEVAEGSYAEETIHGHQDVIDEEILDLWLQTALSEGGVKQQEVLEPGQQMEPPNEEQNDVSSVQTETDKELLVDLNSRELVSDTNMSSSTLESGFSDQSLSEWGGQNNETQLPKSTSTESFQGIYDTLANVPESADIYEISTQQPYSKSLDILMEKAAETRQSYLKEEESITGVTSPEAGHLDQESDKSQEETNEERVESVATEIVLQKEIDAEVTDWKNSEEANAKSLTGMSTPLNVEETISDDGPLEIIMSESPDEVKHTESERSRSGSEASLEEEMVSESVRKTPSVDNLPCIWLDDVSESLPEVNKDEVAEQPTTSEGQMEVLLKDTKEADAMSLTGMNAPLKTSSKEPLEIIVSESLDAVKHTESGQSRSGSEASLEEEMVSESGSQGDTYTESERKSPSVDISQPVWSEDVSESLPEVNKDEVAEPPMAMSEEQMEVDICALDFTAQRSRIAVKNPLVRPPKDPRSLLHMPSLDPSPSLSAKGPAGVPFGGLGIGIKLPGLGAGFPVLKKTQQVVREENSPDAISQQKETEPEDKSDTPKQDEAQHRPKWMPPTHPGFGNPLMSELKTKLKKTTKE